MSTHASSFAVPVVRLILPDKHNRVLLLKRSEESSAGGWCLPGGKIDYGETVESVIRKELKEETGLELRSSNFLFFQDSLPNEAGDTHYLNLYFECEWAGNVTLNRESSAFQWVGRAELRHNQLVFGNDEALERYWKS